MRQPGIYYEGGCGLEYERTETRMGKQGPGYKRAKAGPYLYGQSQSSEMTIGLRI
jgi:hypothetical protein